MAAAAAIATLEVIKEEGFVENARERGAQLGAALKPMQNLYQFIGDVRGIGLMQGIESSASDGNPDAASTAAIQSETTRQGLLTLTCGPAGKVVRLIPALNVTEAEISLGVRRFATAVDVVAGRPT